MPHLRFDAVLPFLFVALTGGGCGSGGDGLPSAETLDPAGTHTTYVVSDINLPENDDEVAALSFDIDGNGKIDNGLGSIIKTVSAVSSAVDLQTSIDEQLARGGVILLASIQATDLVDASGVGMWTHLGSNPSPPACENQQDVVCGKHLTGAASFDVVPNPDGATVMTGSLVGGTFFGGPGETTFSLKFVDGDAPIVVRLVGAQARVLVGSDGLQNGILGGAIAADQVEEEVVPAIHALLLDVAAPDCPLVGDSCCTDPGSSGGLIYGLFDLNDDCDLTVDEFITNPLVSALVAPDVDVFDETGAFNPRTDGVADALSVGIGFTAVSGSWQP